MHWKNKCHYEQADVASHRALEKKIAFEKFSLCEIILDKQKHKIVVADFIPKSEEPCYQ